MRLDPFFSLNPISEHKEAEGSLLIALPWNDPTVRIAVKQKDEGLIEALNSVYLPPSLCAFWHKDTKDIEFVWLPVTADTELQNRSFEINFEGRIIKCEWDISSERLIKIAEVAMMATFLPEQSNYRNLISFQRALNYRRRHERANEKIPGISQPLSFWIRNVDWDQDVITRMCKHVNFYMRYYDTESPIVLIVEEMPKPLYVKTARFPHGNFPSHLNLRSIDPYVLDLWLAAVTVDDPFRKFLHSYQIIEYFSHYYITDKVKEEIRKLLIKPDALNQIDKLTSQVVDAMTFSFVDYQSKLNQLIQECVNPENLWPVADLHRGTFCKPIIFDGGFVQEALIGEKDQMTDFTKAWPATFVKRLDSLRNVLAHAREKRHATGIAPTRSNHDLLRPWADLTLHVASEVIIYHKQ